jgi:glycosyltransferase involved in cell wall biosynthesis
MAGLDGHDIVCFSNDWDGDPLSKMHLMRLASRDSRVLWVNSVGNRAPRATARDLRRIWSKLRGAVSGLREVERRIHVLSPLAVPVYGREWAGALNGRLIAAQVQRAMASLGLREPVVLSYLPGAAPAVGRIDAALRVYHCVDEFSAFDGAGRPIEALERELLAKSDLVIVSSEPLLEAKRRLHPRVELVRHGVDLAHFAKALSPQLPTSPLVRDLPRPVIGFVGLLAEWVDLEALAALAEHYAGGTIVVVGREDCDVSQLRQRRNVVFTGRRSYAELPALLKGMDVALVPFRDGPLARAANPLKAREYLAAGLPVISSPIPEVERLGLCQIARTPAEYVAAIDAIMRVGPGPRAERSAAMRAESWEARWDEIAVHIGDALSRRSGLRKSA